MPQEPQTFTIRHRFTNAVLSRKGTPRATNAEARSKLVHTSRGGRQLVVYVTAPLIQRLRWRTGGHVSVSWALSAGGLLLRLSPSHSGPRLLPCGPKTTTARIVISGSFIAQSACAPVRTVPHTIEDADLILTLPLPWAAVQEAA